MVGFLKTITKIINQQNKQQRIIEIKKQTQFDYYLPQAVRIINESTAIIAKTDSPKTMETRYETIRTILERLIDMKPRNKNLNIQIGNQKIFNKSDLLIIDNLKSDWLSKHQN